jgi:hypothetical protein
MKYVAVIVPNLPAQAMALYPFMLFKNKELQFKERIIRHEQIHFRQQIELLILFFYVFYLLNYLINLLRFGNHEKAYLNISFEREAYENEHDLQYLERRRIFSWIKKL